MKYMHRLSVRVVVAIVIGFLCAGAGIAHVARPCTPADVTKGESISRCVVIEKAFVHPDDLLNNKQNSLVRFSTAFAITSLVAFALLSAISLAQKKKAQA